MFLNYRNKLNIDFAWRISKSKLLRLEHGSIQWSNLGLEFFYPFRIELLNYWTNLNYTNLQEFWKPKNSGGHLHFMFYLFLWQISGLEFWKLQFFERPKPGSNSLSSFGLPSRKNDRKQYLIWLSNIWKENWRKKILSEASQTL